MKGGNLRADTIKWDLVIPLLEEAVESALKDEDPKIRERILMEMNDTATISLRTCLIIDKCLDIVSTIYGDRGRVD